MENFKHFMMAIAIVIGCIAAYAAFWLIVLLFVAYVLYSVISELNSERKG